MWRAIPPIASARGARAGLFVLGLTALVSPVRGAAPSGPPPAVVVSLSAVPAEGRRIVGGQRVETLAGGRWLVAEDRFPPGDVPQWVELPPASGGGFVFFQRIQRSPGTATLLYTSTTFTGPLAAWGRVPLGVESIQLAGEALLLRGRERVVLLAPGAFRVSDALAVPPLPSYRSLVFRSAQDASVEAPFIGALHSRDGGRSWHKGALPPETPPLLEGTYALDPLASRRREWLELVVTQGARLQGALPSGVSKTAYFVALDGTHQVELRVDGRELSLIAKDVEASGSCVPAPGLEPWVVCTRQREEPKEGSETFLGEFLPTLRRVSPSLVGSRQVLAAGGGAVVLSGPCEGPEQDTRRAPGALCLLGRDQTRSFRAAPSLAFGTDGRSVFALEREVTFVPELPRNQSRPPGEESGRSRSGARGVIWVLRDLGTGRGRSYAWEGDSSLLPLALGGVQSNLHRIAGGFGFWLSAGEKYVGVRLEEGHANAGPVQEPLARASFFGAHALSWGALGFAKQTKDGGLTWSETFLPTDGEISESFRRVPLAGCSEVGCVLGELVRVGWTAATPLPIEPPDVLIAVPPRGAARLRFDCAEEMSDVVKWTRLDATNDGLFVVSQGGEARARLEVSPSGGFQREARVRVEYVDPFDSVGLKSSRATRGLYGTALEVEEAWGLLDPSTSFAYSFLEPSGDAGVLLLRNPGGERVLAFEKGGAVRPLRLSPSLSARTFAGVVRKDGEFWVAYRDGLNLVVLRSEADRLDLAFTLPLHHFEQLSFELVEDTRAELGVKVEGEDGTFLYPLSVQGVVGEPLVLPHQGSRPPTCRGEEMGFRYVEELSIAPYVGSSGHPLEVARTSARYVAGEHGLCLDALSARARGVLSLASGFEETRSVLGDVPLIIMSEDGSRTVSCR